MFSNYNPTLFGKHFESFVQLYYIALYEKNKYSYFAKLATVFFSQRNEIV